MTLTRRSFIKLVPFGIATALATGWFLEKNLANSSNLVERLNSTWAVLGTGELSDFPVTWNGSRPIQIDPNDYRLTVDGDVSNPLQLTLIDLQAMSSVNENSTIECVEGWNATISWEGVPLSHLLFLAGAPSEFDHVTVKSANGYATEINQNDIVNLAILIALKAGPAPLRIEHGYPARLVYPTKPGYQWVKYVNTITCARSA